MSCRPIRGASEMGNRERLLSASPAALPVFVVLLVWCAGVACFDVETP